MRRAASPENLYERAAFQAGATGYRIGGGRDQDEARRDAPSCDRLGSSEHPAAASYRALRGRMVDLWAAMPRMASVVDVNRMAAEAKEPKPKAERSR